MNRLYTVPVVLGALVCPLVGCSGGDEGSAPEAGGHPAIRHGLGTWQQAGPFTVVITGKPKLGPSTFVVQAAKGQSPARGATITLSFDMPATKMAGPTATILPRKLPPGAGPGGRGGPGGPGGAGGPASGTAPGGAPGGPMGGGGRGAGGPMGGGGRGAGGPMGAGGRGGSGGASSSDQSQPHGAARIPQPPATVTVNLTKKGDWEVKTTVKSEAGTGVAIHTFTIS